MLRAHGVQGTEAITWSERFQSPHGTLRDLISATGIYVLQNCLLLWPAMKYPCSLFWHFLERRILTFWRLHSDSDSFWPNAVRHMHRNSATFVFVCQKSDEMTEVRASLGICASLGTLLRNTRLSRDPPRSALCTVLASPYRTLCRTGTCLPFAVPYITMRNTVRPVLVSFQPNNYVPYRIPCCTSTFGTEARIGPVPYYTLHHKYGTVRNMYGRPSLSTSKTFAHACKRQERCDSRNRKVDFYWLNKAKKTAETFGFSGSSREIRLRIRPRARSRRCRSSGARGGPT